MKKYFFLSAISLMTLGALTSCDSSSTDPVGYTDNDTYSVAYDRVGSLTKSGGYALTFTFPQANYPSDVVLVYRLKSVVNGQKVWEQIPKTIYNNSGELDYDFDFTVNDVEIFAKGNYDISTTPEYLNNQTFRVVIVPASASKNASVNYADYESVAKYYNIRVK